LLSLLTQLHLVFFAIQKLQSQVEYFSLLPLHPVLELFRFELEHLKLEV
jgi:hypothetical protein